MSTTLSVNSVWPGGSAKDQMFISILAMTGSDMLSTAVTPGQSAQVAVTGLYPSGDNGNRVTVVSHLRALSVLYRFGIRLRSEGQCPQCPTVARSQVRAFLYMVPFLLSTLCRLALHRLSSSILLTLPLNN